MRESVIGSKTEKTRLQINQKLLSADGSDARAIGRNHWDLEHSRRQHSHIDDYKPDIGCCVSLTLISSLLWFARRHQGFASLEANPRPREVANNTTMDVSVDKQGQILSSVVKSCVSLAEDKQVVSGEIGD